MQKNHVVIIYIYTLFDWLPLSIVMGFAAAAVAVTVGYVVVAAAPRGRT